MYEIEKERLKKQTSFTMDDLNLIMKILRAKDGCPWDIEQTHESIVPSLIEETYEAVEAIEMKNSDMLKEELGDVLLQVAFHARISEEAGEFDFSDVVGDVSQKMIVRHPHVFGDVVAETSGDVLKNWDKIKGEEKHPLLRYVNEGDCVYFVHSYFAADCAESVIATAEYGRELTAAVARGNVMGCQFHPEKSGPVGLSILKAFCEMQ